MPTLAELLCEQDQLDAGREKCYAEYAESVPTDDLWRGWWSLWPHNGESYRAVEFHQSGRTVSAEWYVADGVRYTFTGTLGDSGLTLSGARCSDAGTDRFVSPLSMVISRDGQSITLNWDWHILYPRGTEPRRIARAFPEAFLVSFGDGAGAEQRDSVMHALHYLTPPSFALVKATRVDDGWGGEVQLGRNGGAVRAAVVAEAEAAEAAEALGAEAGSVNLPPRVDPEELALLHLRIPQALRYCVSPHPTLRFPPQELDPSVSVAHKTPFAALCSLSRAGSPSVWLSCPETEQALRDSFVLYRALHVGEENCAVGEGGGGGGGCTVPAGPGAAAALAGLIAEANPLLVVGGAEQ